MPQNVALILRQLYYGKISFGVLVLASFVVFGFLPLQDKKCRIETLINIAVKRESKETRPFWTKK